MKKALSAVLMCIGAIALLVLLFRQILVPVLVLLPGWLGGGV